MRAASTWAGDSRWWSVHDEALQTAADEVADVVRALERQYDTFLEASEQRSLLATLPEATFFRRYRETFGS